jgi:hypothetical protein
MKKKYWCIIGITFIIAIIFFILSGFIYFPNVPTASVKNLEDKCPYIATVKSYLQEEYIPAIEETYYGEEDTYNCIMSGCTIKNCNIIWSVNNITFEITEYYYIRKDVGFEKSYAFINGNFNNVSELSQIPFLKHNLFTINESENISRLNLEGKLTYTDKGKIYIFKDFIALVTICRESGSTCCPLDCPLSNEIIDALFLDCKLKKDLDKYNCALDKEFLCRDFQSTIENTSILYSWIVDKCYSTIATTIAEQNSSKALEYCQKIEDKNKEYCYKDIAFYIKNYNSSYAFEICNYITNLPGIRRECLEQIK